MKRWMLVAVMLLIPVVVQAAPSPLAYALRLERVWTQDDESTCSRERTEDVLGSVALSWPLNEYFQLIARGGYRFEGEVVEGAVGIEYPGRAECPKAKAKHGKKKPCR